MLTVKQLNEIMKWRKAWSTTGGRKLSIVGCSTEDEVIKRAVHEAHAPSVVRALKLPAGISTNAARREAAQLLESEFKIKLHTAMTQAEYDKWNMDTCRAIRGIYYRHGIHGYSLGNGQKIVNIAIKKLFSSSLIDPDFDFFHRAHIPLDSIIISVAKKKLGVAPLKESWSKIDDERELLRFQDDVRKNIPDGDFPLIWEIVNW